MRLKAGIAAHNTGDVPRHQVMLSLPTLARFLEAARLAMLIQSASGREVGGGDKNPDPENFQSKKNEKRFSKNESVLFRILQM